MRTVKLVSMGLVALAILGLTAVAQQGQTQEKKVEHMEHNATLTECARACSDCPRACDLSATYCADMLHEGKRKNLPTMETCRYCTTVCSAAEQIGTQGGPLDKRICEACANACGQHATACEALPDDEHMKACA